MSALVGVMEDSKPAYFKVPYYIQNVWSIHVYLAMVDSLDSGRWTEDRCASYMTARADGYERACARGYEEGYLENTALYNLFESWGIDQGWAIDVDKSS